MRQKKVTTMVLCTILLAACDASQQTMAPELRPQYNLGDPTPTNIRVTKSAETAWERRIGYDWTIDKSVAPASVSLAAGASASLDYTVTMERTIASDVSVDIVSGQICVQNVGGGPTLGLVVWDNVQASTNGGHTWTTLVRDTLDTSSSPEVPAGQTRCYAYAIPFTPIAGAIYRNEGVAKFTNSSTAPGGIGIWEYYVTFALPPAPTLTTEEDEGATVADVLTCPAGFTCSAGPGGTTLVGSQTLQYAITVTNTSAACASTFDVANTATVTEGDTGAQQSASASTAVATLSCAPPPTPLRVTKTAGATWKRDKTYDWSVTKSVVSDDELTLAPHKFALLKYKVDVTRTLVSDVSTATVSGQVCLQNDGATPTVGLAVTDNVQASTNGGGSWTTIASGNVDVSGAPVIAGGQTQCYAYTIPFTPVSGATYRNQAVATVTSPAGSYETTTAFALPASPATTITDEKALIGDTMTCPVGFWCSDLPILVPLYDSASFVYPVLVKNLSAPCSHSAVVGNTVTVKEKDTGVVRTASANLTVETPDCAPPTPPQGCSVDFWKQSQHHDEWKGGYKATGSYASKYKTVFGVNLFTSSTTLLGALGQSGSGKYRLGRESVAALLNAAHSGVNFGMTPAEVIALVQSAAASGNYESAANTLASRNNRVCSLGRTCGNDRGHGGHDHDDDRNWGHGW